MKIFTVNRPLDHWDSLWDKALEADAAPRPDILPLAPGADSALVRPGFPCFLPDFAREGWELRLAPVVRVGRLGKWVEPRFAPRYIDALSVAAILRPADPGQGSLPVFDGAIIPGAFRPYVPGGRATLRVWGPGAEEPADIPFSIADLRAEDTLALISRSVTLKSGDLLMPAIFPAAFPAAIGLDFAASIITPGDDPGREPALRARVK